MPDPNPAPRLTALVAALAIVGGVLALVVPRLIAERQETGEAAAVAALGRVFRAEQAWKASGKPAFAHDLTVLAQANFLDDALATGTLARYRFGAVLTDANGRPVDPSRRALYYAVPDAYGDTGRRHLLLDETGRIYAKDPGWNAPPPDRWPGDDPTAQGWRLLTP